MKSIKLLRIMMAVAIGVVAGCGRQTAQRPAAQIPATQASQTDSVRQTKPKTPPTKIVQRSLN